MFPARASGAQNGSVVQTSEFSVVRERYERFARLEAAGRSEVYRAWAQGVCADDAVIAVIARLPANRRQPPLVFAVARMLGAPEADYPAFATWLAAHADEVVAEASGRMLQTNEPQRATLVTAALAGVPGPIALLEIGASAGICLYPDRYAYRLTGDAAQELSPVGGSAVELECAVRGNAPTLALPEIVWRAGIDLNPLDAGVPDDRAFLEALVWPGESGRAERIGRALDVVAADPPLLHAGDASDPAVLRAVVAQAPAAATLVVSLPGVVPHIPRAGRERLRACLDELEVRWISIDPPAMQDGWGDPVPGDWPGFVLRRDGAPLAACDPLGGWLEWRTEARAPRG